MAARDVVLRYLSTFDGSGAEAAQKGNLGVARTVDVLGQSKSKLAKETVDLEVKQRRVEGVTRAMAGQFLQAGSAGLSMQNAANAGAAAISFLGNTMKFASGPLGILVTVGATLAATFLSTAAAAKETKEQTTAVIERSEVYAKALSVLSAAGKDLESNAARKLKANQADAATQEGINKLGNEAAQIIGAQNEALAKHTETVKRLAEAKQALRALTEYDRQVNPQLATQREETVRQLEAEMGRTASAANVAVGNANAQRQAASALVQALNDEEGALEAVIEAEEVRTYSGKALNDLIWKQAGAEYELNQERRRRAEEEKARVRAETQMKIAAANQIAGVAGALAGYLETTGKASFDVVKALRYGEAIINTAAGVANAIATGGPYPYNLIAAASVAAMGAIQVATIAATSPGGGGSVSAPSGGGGGGLPAAGAGERGSGIIPAPGAGGGGGGFSGTVTISIESLVFQGLDPDSVPAGQMRRFVRRFAELLSFEFNGLGNALGR